MPIRTLTVTFSDKRDFFDCYSPEASDGCMFIQTREHCTVGEPVRLRMRFPEIPAGIPLHGYVIWRRVPTQWQAVLPPGIGVRLWKSEQKRLEFVVGFCEGNYSTRRKTGERANANLRVDFNSKEYRESGLVRNISYGGLFIETKKLLPPTTPLEMNIYLKKASSPKYLLGHVVWNREYVAESGLGVKFRLLSATAREKAAYLVESLDDNILP